jgi:hypothetical protein
MSHSPSTAWNPSHFLDTAEMSLAVAVGLDWFHDWIGPDIRAELVDGLTDKGLAAGDRFPESGHANGRLRNRRPRVRRGIDRRAADSRNRSRTR